MKSISVLILIFFLISGHKNQAQDQFAGENYRAFDFWLGEWSVDLLQMKDEGKWEVTRHGHTRVFNVLDGKAIMELWNEDTVATDGIRGFSLRYYNPEKGQWDLILHWPRSDWGRIGIFQGRQRHRRFEFFNEYPVNDSVNQIARYTFSDITPASLRWDDAYSRDDGQTWRSNWIMEFTREKDNVDFPGEVEGFTYVNGEKCSASQYDVFRDLAQIDFILWHGTEFNVQTFRILDGCALLQLMKNNSTGLQEKLLLYTYNSPEEVYELIELNADTSPYKRYRGEWNNLKGNGDILLITQDGKNLEISKR